MGDSFSVNNGNQTEPKPPSGAASCYPQGCPLSVCPLPMRLSPSRLIGWILLVTLTLVFLVDVGCHIAGENYWFEELGYPEVFIIRLRTRMALWATVLVVSGGVVVLNLRLARRLCDSRARQPKALANVRPGSMGLSGLLATLTGLSLLLMLLISHYGTIAWDTWRPDLDRSHLFPPLPVVMQLQTLTSIFDTWGQQPLWWAGVGGLMVLLASVPWLTLGGLAVLMVLGLGFILAGQWARILASFHPSSFGTLAELLEPGDRLRPIFSHDLSFYIFTIPMWKLVQFWSFGLLLYTLVAVLVIYLLSGQSIESGRFPGFSVGQQHHLYGLGIGFLISTAGNYILASYDQLYSPRGVTYGASYTDVIVQVPINQGLAIGALLLAVWSGLHMLAWWLYTRKLQTLQVLGPYCEVTIVDSSPNRGFVTLYGQPYAVRNWQQKVLSNRWLLLALAFYCLSTVVIGEGLPTGVQNLIVQPNELERETPYMKRTIAATREAFGLNNIEVHTFDPTDVLTIQDLITNTATLRNIRLWDSRPLLQTNRQLQQIRLYYSFPDADLDRYTFQRNGQPELQQVLLAAREMDYSAVPAEAQTWVNEHLVYTHGYGFTLSPVNTIGPGGLPDYFVRDIGDADKDSALYIASDAVRDSIPIGQPRLYYGALAHTYVMTSTRVQELDYPSGNENFYNVYDGSGGVSLGRFWQRLIYAVKLRDWQMLFTRNFTPETKLLFRREIKERIQTIAPFLLYDRDPYLVIADPHLQRVDGQLVPGGEGIAHPGEPDFTEAQAENYLYWVVDAYTTTDRYPYSDPGDRDFNYIRNSVKVVVDAYNGAVSFYIADPEDPLIKTWSQVFPHLFQPIAAMPPALREHTRYPSQLFKVQSDQLLTYHMTDPQVFYNREDQWQVPQEIYGGEPQPIESYYLIMRLPTEEEEEFILLTPFTPVSRSNLVAWLAGRSDEVNYGKLLLYEFPKQRLIFGPEQIEARINQDPVISQRITLWNRQGSQAIQGNLLVIPLEESLLYVEPLYLESDRNSLPTLVRVIVVYDDRIVMAESLAKALKVLFQEGTGTLDAAPSDALTQMLEGLLGEADPTDSGTTVPSLEEEEAILRILEN